MCCPTPRPTRCAGRSTCSTISCPRCSFPYRRSSSWRGCRSRSVSGVAGPSWSSVLPVAIVLVDGFFFWEWSPNWLDPRLNDLMMWIDPSGFRWLNETWLKVDRGVSFYNNEAIPPDRGFLISRVVLVALGFVAVASDRFHFAASLRGATSRRTSRSAALQRAEETRRRQAPARLPGLAGHDHGEARTSRGGLASGACRADRAALESRPLSVHPLDPVTDGRHGARRRWVSSTRRS